MRELFFHILNGAAVRIGGAIKRIGSAPGAKYSKCNDTWNGYEIVGAIRESYIDGVWNKGDESEWLTEIQVPIRKICGTRS